MSEDAAFTREELKSLLLSVGSHKADRRLSPAEVGALLNRALTSGKSRQAISDQLGIGTTQVNEFLKIAELSPSVRDMAGWSGRTGGISNTVPFSSLAQLRGLSDVDQLRAAKAILSYGLTWKEVVQVTQLHRRSSRDLDDCVQEVIGMRTTVEIRHVLVGSINDSAVQHRLADMSQLERDELLKLSLGNMDMLSDLISSSRLGATSFVLVGRADIAESEGVSPDEVEDRVLGALRRELEAMSHD